MGAKPIFISLPGVFGKQEQSRIRAAGYCFVESNNANFDMFKVVDVIAPIDSQHVFKAAMFAIANAGTGNNPGPKTLFGETLSKKLSEI